MYFSFYISIVLTTIFPSIMSNNEIISRTALVVINGKRLIANFSIRNEVVSYLCVKCRNILNRREVDYHDCCQRKGIWFVSQPATSNHSCSKCGNNVGSGNLYRHAEQHARDAGNEVSLAEAFSSVHSTSLRPRVSEVDSPSAHTVILPVKRAAPSTYDIKAVKSTQNKLVKLERHYKRSLYASKLLTFRRWKSYLSSLNMR